MRLENIQDLYQDIVKKYGEISYCEGMTYAQFGQKIQSKAVFLKQQGIKSGDIVAILSLNSLDWIATFFAITQLGAIALPLDTNLKLDNYHQMLAKVKAKFIMYSKDFSFEYQIPGALLESAQAGAISFPKVDPQTIAAIFFTSGTTSDPKIVQLTHANIVMTAHSCVQFIDIKPRTKLLMILPMYHIYGLAAICVAVMSMGCSYVFLNSLTGPDIVKALKEEKVNFFPVVPQVLELFLDGIVRKLNAGPKFKKILFMSAIENPGFYKYSGLEFLRQIILKPVKETFGPNFEFFASGGAALKPKYYKAFRNMGYEIVEGYGLTETTGPISGSDKHKNKPGNVGKDLPGNEIAIRQVRPDGVGEIWVKGVSVMPGYYQNDKANREVFDGEWFNTGDLGYRDAEGDLCITGRAKNVIVMSSGKNVYPEELETYYKNSKLISEISVFEWKSEVFAVIVPIENIGWQEIEDEIERLNNGLPSYKKINGFALSNEPLPKTSTRKPIVREIIKKLDSGIYTFDESDTRERLRFADPRQTEILEYMEKRFDELFHKGQKLSELNLDSLQMLEFAAHLDKILAVKIKPELLNPQLLIEDFVIKVAALDFDSSADIFNGQIKYKCQALYNPLVELLFLMFRGLANLLWSFQFDYQTIIEQKNVVLSANHQSNLDALLILSAIPYRYRRKLYILGKKELAFLKFIFPGIPVINVNRKGNTLESLQAGSDVLRQGSSLLIFPEGTRSIDGSLLEFKVGAALLAKKLNKNIIPICIKGAFQVMPRHTIIPKIGDISATVLASLSPKNFKSTEELNDELSKVIADEFNA